MEGGALIEDGDPETVDIRVVSWLDADKLRPEQLNAYVEYRFPDNTVRTKGKMTSYVLGVNLHRILIQFVALFAFPLDPPKLNSASV